MQRSGLAPGNRPTTRISFSPGMVDWLLDQRLSLAFTSYQTGRLILAGVGPDGRMSFNEQDYTRAMGLHYAAGELHVASLFQIWRLANLLRPGEFANRAHDCVLVPRTAHCTGYLDVHELSVDGGGRLVFVNSRYSCLAVLDERFSFRPIWKPRFVSALVPEDRCHLNGLAMADGAPRYVTAVAATDTAEGWRGRPEGGVVVDVGSGEIVTDRLSMPHSPRVHGGRLWVLDSGRGMLATVDERSGTVTPAAFCPGFLRGMAMAGDYAVVATSKPRRGDFGDLPLQQELERRGLAPSCGLFVVDLRSGDTVEHIRFETEIDELFDVALLPGLRNPTSIGPATEEILGSVRFDPDSASPLFSCAPDR